MLQKQGFWIWTTVLYMLALLAGSLKPELDTTPHSKLQEMLHNFFHLPAYAMLAFILMNTFRAFNRRRVNLWVFLISVGYGGLIEILQGFVPGRTPSLGDESLNMLGTALVLLCLRR